MKPYIFPTFFVCLFFVHSCRKVETTVDDNIVMSMYENRNANAANSLAFFCTTTKKYDCENYSLSTSFEKIGTVIIVNFKAIERPVKCKPGSYPAVKDDLDLGILKNGKYGLIIMNGTKKATGSITVNDESYNVSFQGGNNVSFKYDRLYKIPEHTIWGGIFGDTVYSSLINKYFDSIVYSGAHPFTGTPGEYGAFTLDSNYSIPVQYADETLFGKNFIYSYSGDYNKLQSLIKNCKAKTHDSVTFFIDVFDGRIF